MKAKAARKAAKDVQLLDTQVKQELISAPWKHAVAPVKRPPGLGLSLQPKMENPEADDEPVAGMPCSQAEKSGCFNEILGSFKRNLLKTQDFPSCWLAIHTWRWRAVVAGGQFGVSEEMRPPCTHICHSR